MPTDVHHRGTHTQKSVSMGLNLAQLPKSGTQVAEFRTLRVQQHFVFVCIFCALRPFPEQDVPAGAVILLPDGIQEVIRLRAAHGPHVHEVFHPGSLCRVDEGLRPHPVHLYNHHITRTHQRRRPKSPTRAAKEHSIRKGGARAKQGAWPWRALEGTRQLLSSMSHRDMYAYCCC